MRKLLVLADKHTQFFVVDTDIIFYHIPWRLTTHNIVLNKIEYHIRVIHRGITVTFLRKTIVVIPRFHYSYQFIYSMSERTVCRIVSQHFAHFLFSESHHFVKFGCKRIIGADIESASQIVHRHGADARYETTLDTGISTCFYLVEESAEITFAMCFVGITIQAFGVGKYGIGEVVVLINKKIDILTGTFTLMTKEVELIDRPILFVQPFFNTLWQKVGINFTEIVKTDLAMRIQSFTVVTQFADNAGEIKIKHQITITVTGRILAYI